MLKRLLLVLSLAIGALLLSPAPEADASGWSRHNNHKTYKSHHYKKYKKGHPKSHAVPELDPSAAGSAMVLLLGGVAIIASRRRQEDIAQL
jgi:hypothetical protein